MPVSHASILSSTTVLPNFQDAGLNELLKREFDERQTLLQEYTESFFVLFFCFCSRPEREENLSDLSQVSKLLNNCNAWFQHYMCNLCGINMFWLHEMLEKNYVRDNSRNKMIFFFFFILGACNYTVCNISIFFFS